MPCRRLNVAMMPAVAVLNTPLLAVISFDRGYVGLPIFRRSTPPLVFLAYEPDIMPKYMRGFVPSPYSWMMPMGL